ncbi:MAG TPA: serine/threonine-protein kinase [Kofleriaceae bacterium]
MSGLVPGISLGRYQILTKLADGMMAEIYLARLAGQAGFEKLVVIKRIKVAHDRAALAMFLDEARLAATLHHSNIAEVIDVGESNGTYFFAMEYVNGRDARAILATTGGALPLGVALAITMGVASALAYAHEKTSPDGPLRIVHRDVSPSNILVSYDGAVKLVDFGIARATSRTAKTLTGVLKGKVPYMSPEQARGKVLDRRSDLFSLGIVLYELTTGQRPFQGKSEYELLEAIAAARARSPTVIDRSYPLPLEDLVMKLLERDPQQRFQSAETVLAALDATVSRLGIYASSLNLSKFMREAFAEDSVREPVVDLPVIHTPPPEAFHRHGEDETTSGSSNRYTEPMRRRAPSETTSPDLVPYEPVDAFGAELERELELDAIANEEAEQRAARRIDTLVDRAFACFGAGELEMAITCVELALGEEERSYSPIPSVYHHRSTIMAILEGFVGDPDQVVRLMKPRDELLHTPELERAHALIARTDGLSSVNDLLVMSGLSPLETYRQLCALLIRDVVTLR